MKTKQELERKLDELVFRDWWPYHPEDYEQLMDDIAALKQQLRELEEVGA